MQWLAAVPGLRAWAETVSFPGKHAATLRQLATIVLPSSLEREATDRVVERFVGWVRGYKAGADMDHGYGLTRLRSKGPSPASSYLAQLEDLGALSRESIVAALERAKIAELPRMPDGKHIVSDFMSFYYRGSDANDLCYRAAIQRDRCRGLDGSQNPPPPLEGAG